MKRKKEYDWKSQPFSMKYEAEAAVKNKALRLKKREALLRKRQRLLLKRQRLLDATIGQYRDALAGWNYQVTRYLDNLPCATQQPRFGLCVATAGLPTKLLMLVSNETAAKIADKEVRRIRKVQAVFEEL